MGETQPQPRHDEKLFYKSHPAKMDLDEKVGSKPMHAQTMISDSYGFKKIMNLNPPTVEIFSQIFSLDFQEP